MGSGFGRDGERSGKAAIAGRLRSIRGEIFGEDGAPAVAERLGLPLRTWLDYENGATIPAEVMLRYLMLTDADPLWMLTGDGARYRRPTLRNRTDAR